MGEWVGGWDWLVVCWGICGRRIVMVLDVFMVYVKLNGGVDKPYATVCQRQANLPVLSNILAIEQLQWERAKIVLV